jgi:hypothetical protein
MWSGSHSIERLFLGIIESGSYGMVRCQSYAVTVGEGRKEEYPVCAKPREATGGLFALRGSTAFPRQKATEKPYDVILPPKMRNTHKPSRGSQWLCANCLLTFMAFCSQIQQQGSFIHYYCGFLAVQAAGGKVGRYFNLSVFFWIL